jgi:hypothetical protein
MEVHRTGDSFMEEEGLKGGLHNGGLEQWKMHK